jgi:hypothetical protein
MNIKDLEQKFSANDRIVIKRFLAFVNENSLNDSNFANDSSLDQLNQFSDITESDEQITQSVKDWLRLKKVRLRGSQTNN